MNNSSLVQDSRGGGGRKQLAKNTIYSTITSLADILLLLLLIFAGRFLGAEKFGFFSYALALTTILVFATNLGIDNLAIREIAINKDKTRFIVNVTLGWKFVLSFILLVIFLILSTLLVQDDSTLHLLYVLAPAAILRSLNVTLRSFLQSHEKFVYETYIVVTERTVLFILGCIVIFFWRDPMLLGACFVSARVISLTIYIYILSRTMCSIRPFLDFGYIKSFQVKALPIGITALIFGVYMQIDTIILGMLDTAQSVGKYGAAMKIYEGLLVLPMIINSVFYPRLSMLSSNTQHFSELLLRAVKYISILSGLIILISVCFANEIMYYVFGIEYANAGDSLLALMIAVSFFFLVSIFNTGLRALAKHSLAMFVLFAGLCCKIIFDLILIPNYSIYGASISSLASSVIMVFTAYYYLNKSILNELELIKFVPAIIISLAISSLLLFLLKDMAVLIRLFAVILIYPSLILLLRVLDNLEFELLKNFFSVLILKK